MKKSNPDAEEFVPKVVAKNSPDVGVLKLAVKNSPDEDVPKVAAKNDQESKFKPDLLAVAAPPQQNRA
jgi:hypothetical protein